MSFCCKKIPERTLYLKLPKFPKETNWRRLAVNKSELNSLELAPKFLR